MSTGAVPPSALPSPAPDLGWIARELELMVRLDGGESVAALNALAGLALRRNPRRAHLLVSRVLGKHLPVEPHVALRAAAKLAAQVRAVTADQPLPPVVLGFAETATALGQAVASALPGAECVLSTRRPGKECISFEEEHSHAVGHRVLAPPAFLDSPRSVVLVDDELSSGRTAINTMRALHQRSWHPGYVIATLLDMRSPDARADFDRLAGELGVPVRAVSLLSGTLEISADAPERVAPLVAAADPPQHLEPRWPSRRIGAGWPKEVRLTARYGWTPADEAALDRALRPLVERLVRDTLGDARRVLVLGTEELMYAPMRLADVLAFRLAGAQVHFQSTTRSPVAPIDREGYAVRCALAFPAPDEPERQSFVYNVQPGLADHILVVTDGGDTGPLLAALSGCAPVTEVLLRDEVGGLATAAGAS